MKRIFFVLPPLFHILDLGGPMQVLASLPELGLADVEIRCVGPLPQLCSFQGSMHCAVAPLPTDLGETDVIVVVGAKLYAGWPQEGPHQKIVQWLKESTPKLSSGLLIASVCTGALLLAEAGILDQRLCTTHHHYLKALQQLAPQAQVLANRILVQDGPIYTSAGVTAGNDLALCLIEQHFGSAIALRVARENLLQFRRLEDDPALKVRLRYRDHQHTLVHAVQDYLTEQPNCELSFEQLADHFHISYRHLARLFQQACGIGLKQYQQQLRLELARRLLTDSGWPLERIAEHCGFGSLQAFRAAWRQEQTVSPSQWRRAGR